jgi:hypothetical protein
LKAFPARNASNVTRAIAATIQGSDEAAAGRTSDVISDRADATAFPQLRQNRAPGLSWDPQLAHAAGSREAPQLEQNFPDPRCPHDAQTTSVVDASVMRYNLHGVIVICR